MRSTRRPWQGRFWSERNPRDEDDDDEDDEEPEVPVDSDMGDGDGGHAGGGELRGGDDGVQLGSVLAE